MSDLYLDQYTRVLESLTERDPQTAVEESGFLEFLVSEQDGGAGASLEELFPLAVETGRHLPPVDLLAQMARRLADPVPRGLAAVLAAGEMAGALAKVEELTLDYARARKQFGREIGKFQAVQQQLAVLSEEVIAARMAAEMAFVGNPADVPEPRAAVAKITANRAATKVAAIAHAVHGAIGVSKELALHRYTRRLRQLALAHGGESLWAHELGAWALADSRDMLSLARAI